MIVSGTNPPISIDLGKNEPGMTLQSRNFESRYLIWHDYKMDGETVKSPVNVDALPPGVYLNPPGFTGGSIL
jgi:hypothetical protein